MFIHPISLLRLLIEVPELRPVFEVPLDHPLLFLARIDVGKGERHKFLKRHIPFRLSTLFDIHESGFGPSFAQFTLGLIS